MKRLTASTLLTLAALLTACGSSTSEPQAPIQNPPAETVPVTPQPTPTPQPGYNWYPESDRPAVAEELELLRLTNEVRARGTTCAGVYYPPVPPLAWNDQLGRAARNHAQDMGKRNYQAHDTPEGVRPVDRITLTGYMNNFKSWSTGENIAWGQYSPAEAVAWWTASPGHCRNMMRSSYREFGGGFFHDNEATDPFHRYWVQEFGSRS